MDMNLQQLKILVLISKHKNLTKVAEILNLKQPTVTFHMKKLEQFAEVPLFEMKHKRVLLTHAGDALAHYANRIVTWVEEAEQVLDDYRHYRKGKIMIGASNTPATYFLPKLLGRMQQAYPHVQIYVKVNNSPQIVEMIKEFEIDLGLAAEHQIDDPELEIIPLLEDELGLVMRPDHPFAQEEQIHPERLRNEKWIVREKDSASRRMYEKWALQHQFNIRENMELGATEAIKQAVIHRFGIAILSRLAVTEELNEGKLIYKKIPSTELTRGIFLIYNRNRYITPVIRDFIQLFKQQADKQQ